MPEMNGVEFLQELVKQKIDSKFFFISVGVDTTSSLELKPVEGKYQGIVSKPFEEDELIKMIKELLSLA